MEQLIHLLHTIAEYRSLLEGLENNRTTAVTGIGQINRSHLIAGLCQDAKRPLVIVCQDDIAARRLQEDLKDFLGVTVPILPGRELTLYDAAAVSRAWEQKRIGQLYALSLGETPIQIFTWESLSLRTMPPAVMKAAAFTLEVGKEYPLEELAARLTAAGYNRSPMVEGVGQFTVRGGIVDIYSPGADSPVRAEFFGDELDTLAPFDTDTQRRGENIASARILPVAETVRRCTPTASRGFVKIFAVSSPARTGGKMSTPPWWPP